MRKNLLFVVAIFVVSFLFSTCSLDSGRDDEKYAVVPPTWKGFDYRVKKGGDGEETDRGEINPGDVVRVYCYRKSNGLRTGQIKGTITLKWTTQADGPSTTVEMTETVMTPANESFDGWKDYSYANFKIPDGGPYVFRKAAVSCSFTFECFGQSVKWEDRTSHVDPYIGSIFTTNCIGTFGSASTMDDVVLWTSN